MKRADFLYCAGVDAPRFKLLKQRGQAPFGGERNAEEPAQGWGEYSLDDAFRLRLMLNLVGGESEEVDHLGGLRPSDAAILVREAINLFPQHPLIQTSPFDWWLGVVVFDRSDDQGRQALHPKLYAGEAEQLSAWLAEQTEPQDKRPVRIFLASVSRVAEWVQDRAKERDQWQEEHLAALHQSVDTE